MSVDVLARTIWGEARGENTHGMHAVANVIMNRANHPRWWGGPDIASVCKRPWQFSVWNSGDPNRGPMLTVTTRDPQFAEAWRIAEAAAAGQLEDITHGADHYHATHVSPNWSWGRAPVTQIGRHRFYRLEIPEPRPEPPRYRTGPQARPGEAGEADALGPG